IGREVYAGAAVAARALYLFDRAVPVDQRDVRDRHQAAPIVTAEVDDPPVVRARVRGGDLRIVYQAFPSDPEGRIEQGCVDLLVVHRPRRGRGVVPAGWAAVLVTALADGHQIRRVHADAAQRAEPAAQCEMRMAIDEQHLDALGVALDADSAVAQLGLQV